MDGAGLKTQLMAGEWLRVLDYPIGVKIRKVERESESVKTFYLDAQIDAKPGQFVMLWLPRVDEKPFGLSSIGKETAVSVQKKGKFTEKLHSLKEGDIVGIRGPYGNGFKTENVKDACIVAGGIGVAPLVPLAESLEKPAIILGARNKDEVLFEERLKKAGDLYITTDDGSRGEKGFNVQVLERLLKEGKKFDSVFTCGPEMMMVKVFEICEKYKIPLQASLERYMKCGGLGVCGQCSVNGIRVCTDGPIFGSEVLRKLGEFGNTARLKSGKKVPLKEYAGWRQK